MNKAQLFAKAKEKRPLIQSAFDYMLTHPETGFREWKATSYLAAEYEKLGYKPQLAGNIPGFFVDIDTGRIGPKLLILGELDGLPVPGHPYADPETHAAHACGHNAQSAVLLGLAALLAETGALDGLCGSIRLCAVPAEELVEHDFRESLRKSGIIHYYGGKQEFLYRGYFDGCDLAFMIHTGGGRHNFRINSGANGCILKRAIFEGKAAHAATPSCGINALDAASIALQAVNAQRATFREMNYTRVHPILTEAGTAVNSIPGRVVMENLVRAANIEACRTVNTRVNRAIAAAAAAVGAKVHLSDRPGYLPAAYDANLCKLALSVFTEVVGAEKAVYNCSKTDWETGCTDMADISAVMPALHCYGSGSVGAGHSKDYAVVDFDSAFDDSLTAQFLLVQALLRDDAVEAKHIIRDAVVRFPTRADYFAYLDALFYERDAVLYEKNSDRVILDL